MFTRDPVRTPQLRVLKKRPVNLAVNSREITRETREDGALQALRPDTEIRNPNIEIRNKFEIQNPKEAWGCALNPLTLG